MHQSRVFTRFSSSHIFFDEYSADLLYFYDKTKASSEAGQLYTFARSQSPELEQKHRRLSQLFKEASDKVSGFNSQDYYTKTSNSDILSYGSCLQILQAYILADL